MLQFFKNMSFISYLKNENATNMYKTNKIKHKYNFSKQWYLKLFIIEAHWRNERKEKSTKIKLNKFQRKEQGSSSEKKEKKKTVQMKMQTQILLNHSPYLIALSYLKYLVWIWLKCVKDIKTNLFYFRSTLSS